MRNRNGIDDRRSAMWYCGFEGSAFGSREILPDNEFQQRVNPFSIIGPMVTFTPGRLEFYQIGATSSNPPAAVAEPLSA